MKLVPIRTGMFLVALAAAWPAAADTQFQIRRTNRDDIPLGKGQCDIRLQVDNEVEVSVVRDTVRIRTISGRDAFDDGSECNAPLPDRDMEGFGFDVRDRRNEIQLLAEPSRRNNFQAVVRIRDTSGGQGRYHFRITWNMTGSDYRGPGGMPGRPGFGRAGTRRTGLLVEQHSELSRPGPGHDDRGDASTNGSPTWR